LSLGSQDATTGWYAKSFSESTISMVILRRGQSFSAGGVGFYAVYDYTGFTADTVAEGDEIKDADSVYFTVKTVGAEKWGDQLSHYVCELVKKESYATGSATSCPSGDQISNGGFETFPDTSWSMADWSQTVGSKKNGSYGAESSTGGALISQNLDVPLACFDSTIEISFWYYNTVGSGVAECYCYVEFSNGYRAPVDDLLGIAAWTQWDSNINLANLLSTGKVTRWDRLTAIGFKMYPSPSGTFYLDDVTLELTGSAATGVVWHTGYWGTSTDPRHRHKVLLDTYLDGDNLRKDDGVTPANYITCFGSPEYPMSMVFNGKTRDLIFSVSSVEATPKEDYRHKIYAYDEKVEIVCYAVDKTGITATNLLEQAEQEIRRIATTYPTGSLRRIDVSKPSFTLLGTQKLWHTTITINYRIANTHFNPDAPAFGHTIGFTFECDRRTGGVEGVWDLEDGGSTGTMVVDEYNNFDMEITNFVADMDTFNDTDLSLSTTIYTHMRFRYKTSGNATAKITVHYNGEEGAPVTILSETASSTWTVADVELTAGKTLDHIFLWCCDGIGHVYWDFVQVHGGERETYVFVEPTPDYIMPNCVKLELPASLKAPVLEIPGFSGTKSQKLGSRLEVHMTCDLTVEVPCGAGEQAQVDSDAYMRAAEWMRPQNDQTKTDKSNIDVFLELLHLGGSDLDYPWTWLKLGDPDMQFKAELIEVRPSLTGEEGMVDLVWREYRHGNASDETYKERFGIGL